MQNFPQRFRFDLTMQERPELETERQELIMSTTRLQKDLVELEGNILQLLSDASGDILEDEVLIQTLSQSKTASEEVASALAQASVTEKRINDTRVLCVSLHRATKSFHDRHVLQISCCCRARLGPFFHAVIDANSRADVRGLKSSVFFFVASLCLCSNSICNTFCRYQYSLAWYMRS
jgi:hypothetical protein